MDNLTEAVARGMCKANGRDPDALGADGQKYWTFHAFDAEAAIAVVFEQLSEPTTEMIEAAHLASLDENPHDTEAALVAVFKAMLNAAKGDDHE